MNYLPLLAMRVLNRPQMLLPEKLATIMMLLDGRIGSDASNLSAHAGAMPVISRPEIGNRTSPHFSAIGGVAVIGVVGTLVARGDLITNSSGVLSYDRLQAQIRHALADDSISAIVFDIDSPGGEAIGAFELADFIRYAATRKPIVSSVTGLCCSAAYAIAASTSRIVATKSSLVGSIGVIGCHIDRSDQMKSAGLTPTLIYAGDRKADGNSFERLSDEARTILQKEVDALMKMFADTIAEGRPQLSMDAIYAQQAAVYMGADAIDAGLVDEIATLSDVVRKLSVVHKAAALKGPKVQVFASQDEVDRARAAGVRAGAALAMTKIKA